MLFLLTEVKTDFSSYSATVFYKYLLRGYLKASCKLRVYLRQPKVTFTSFLGGKQVWRGSCQVVTTSCGIFMSPFLVISFAYILKKSVSVFCIFATL